MGSPIKNEAFLRGVYAFQDPKAWVVKGALEQPNTIFYPPIHAFSTKHWQIQVEKRARFEDFQNFAESFAEPDLKTIFLITHGLSDGRLEWFGDYMEAKTLRYLLRRSLKLDEGVEVHLMHCYMDETGTKVPAQVYVEEIFPILIEDSELAEVETRSIPDRPSSGGRIVVGDGDKIVELPPD
jgi:hypothetical protein